MPRAPSEVMQEWFRRVWNEGDESAIFGLFAEQGIAHGLGPDPVVGPTAFRDFWRNMRNDFDEVRVEVLDTSDAGDDCVAGGTCYLHMKAYLRRGDETWSLEGFNRCQIADSRIQECWNCWDWLALLNAMGRVAPDTLPTALARPL